MHTFWLLLLIGVALAALEQTACTTEHLFCFRNGEYQTNKPQVVLRGDISKKDTFFSGSIRVMSGHELAISGILNPGTFHITGDLRLSGGARLSIYEMTTNVSGTFEARDDSGLTVSISSYIVYGKCAVVRSGVSLFIEAVPSDPLLQNPINVLRPRSSVSCVEGQFEHVAVGSLQDQSNGSSQAEGSSCAGRAGSLAVIFGSVNCPAPPPAPPSPPPPIPPSLPPPPPTSLIVDSPSPLPPPSPTPTTPVEPQQSATNPPAANKPDDSIYLTIIVVLCVGIIVSFGLCVAVLKVPSLRARLFPYRDREYNDMEYAVVEKDASDTPNNSGHGAVREIDHID